MKKTKMKRLIAKVVISILCLGAIISSTVLGISAFVATAATEATLNKAYDKYSWGAPSVTDPTRNETDNGVYYTPTSYVYFGSYYDETTGKTVQVLNRVLDADADNTGKTGAMFLLTENGIAAESYFFHWSSVGISGAIDYENVYTQSRVSISDSLTLYGVTCDIFNSTEREFIRGIIKTDNKAEMQDLFAGFVEGVDTYYLETDTVDGLPYQWSDREVTHSETAQYLNESKFFLLSAKEIYDYIGNYPYAETLRATNHNGDGITWWTRTGLGESYEQTVENWYNVGNHVVGIDASGNLVPVSVDDETAYTRIGFNLETDKIAYSQRVDDNTYRIALKHPKYTADEFKAEIVKREDGAGGVSYVTLAYSGTLGIKSTAKDKGYITVVVEDEDGNIKYYGNIAEVAPDDYKSGMITDTVGEVKFALPSDYNEETDRIVVFYEQKGEDENSTSYISNRVTFDCAHSVSYPTCTSPAVCDYCEKNFGDVNPEAHGARVDYNRYISDGNGTHWYECSGCEARILEEECTYGNACTTWCVDCVSPREIDRSLCRYDENGFCIYDRDHYEPPTYIKDGIYTRVVIENVGNWLSFAETVNSGSEIYDDNGRYVYSNTRQAYIELMTDLDFTGYDFIPIGNAEHYVTGFFTTLGKDRTIKGIDYSSENGCVGLFGHAKNFDIEGRLILTESSFSGASSVGALIGYGDNVSIRSVKVINGVTVSAEDGTEGAFIGTVGGEEKSNISGACVAIGVTNAEDANLAFSSGGNVGVNNSFCLFETDGEDGKTSAATFASGAVANILQSIEPGWTQIVDKTVVNDWGEEEPLDAEPFPRYVPLGENGIREETLYRVYTISNCDGEIVKYTNNVSRSYTVHKPQEVLEWIWDAPFCDVRVKCALCGVEETMEAHVELDYTYVPVRGDYIATILDPNGNAYTDSEGNVLSDEITIIGIRIESMIGMTNVEVVYDGLDIYPEDVMNNHRLNQGTPYPAAKEYEVFFVNPETGEKYAYTYTDSVSGMWVEKTEPLGVKDVGVYDLLVIGKNDYEGQEYTFKGALTILPAVVKIEPYDVCKYYDGDGHFEPRYDILESEVSWYIEELFSIEYEKAVSADAGVYELKVNLTSKANDSNIKFVLTRDTVQAVILPKLYVDVANKSYPTEFTYGDTIPVPNESYFDFTSGSTLMFEWYRADIERYQYDAGDGNGFVEYCEVLNLWRIDGAPRDVGDYVLRVKASATGNLAASYTDIVVAVKQLDSLSIQLELDGYERYGDFYIVDMGDEIKYTVHGLKNGETADSVGLTVDITVDTAEIPGGWIAFDRHQFPNQPNSRGYVVSYTVNDPSGNYKKAGTSVSVMIKTTDAYPVDNSFLYDGDAKRVDVVLTWNHYEGANRYRLIVTDENGNETEIIRTVGTHITEDIRNGNIFAVYSVSMAGSYNVKVYVDDSLIQSFDFKVDITDENGTECDEIIDLGRYEVTVSTDGNQDTSNSADVYVKREIVMLVKECEYDLDSGTVVFDPTKIVMEAGKVIMLGHTLEDVYISVDAINGKIVVSGFKVVDQNGNDVSYYYELNNTVYSWRHNKDEGGNDEGENVAHIFDSYCDSTCNVARCEYTRYRTHSGGMATCTDLALCDYCHGPYGEYSTENHLSKATHIAPNGENLQTHLLIHSCCGQTAEVLEHVEQVAATCISRAMCADCGWEYGDVDPENHASDDCTYVYIDEQGHSCTHTCCGAEENQEHSGGEADCQSRAICQHCAEGYGNISPDNHNGNIEYLPDENDETKHVEKYNCCNTSASVAHSGGSATCVSRAVCQYCGEEYGKINAYNHASDKIVYTVRTDNASMHDMHRECCGEFLGKEYHAGGEGNCVSSTICQHCNTEYGSEMNSENHASAEFIFVALENENAHAKVHACCGAEVERSEHSGGEASCLHGKLCEYCTTEYTDTVEHTFANGCTSICSVCNQQARAEAFHVDANTDGLCDTCQKELSDKKLSGGAISGIATAATVVSGTGAFSLGWFVIKKKSWMELLKLLIG